MGNRVQSLRIVDARGITHFVGWRSPDRAVGGWHTVTACGQDWNMLDRHFRKTRTVDCMMCIDDNIAREASWTNSFEA